MLPEAGQGGEEPWLRESSSLGDFASAHERSESNQRTITGFILLLGAREQLEKSQIDISQEKHCTSQLPYCDTALECDDFQGSNTILLYIQALQARRNGGKKEKREDKSECCSLRRGGYRGGLLQIERSQSKTLSDVEAGRVFVRGDLNCLKQTGRYDIEGGGGGCLHAGSSYLAKEGGEELFLGEERHQVGQ